MKEKTVQELFELKNQNADFQLIDVREEHEFDIAEIGGLLIPLSELLDRHDEISKDKPVIVHCRSGKRSANAIIFLEENFGFDNLYNLKGGILAYAQEIDNSLTQY